MAAEGAQSQASFLIVTRYCWSIPHEESNSAVDLQPFSAPVGVVRPDTWARPPALVFGPVAMELCVLGALFFGPLFREYSPTEFLVWGVSAIALPAVFFGALAARFSSLRQLVRENRSPGSTVFAFASGALRSAPGEIDPSDAIGAGCIVIDSSPGQFRIMALSNSVLAVFSRGDIRRVKRGELLGRWVFMPMLYIEFADGEQLLAWVVHTDIRDLFGIGRRGLSKIAMDIVDSLAKQGASL